MSPEPEPVLTLLSSPNWMATINTIVLFVLLICSALISGSEIAFFSISQTELDRLTEKTKGKSTVVKLLKNPSKLLASILITNNFINILLVLVFASLGGFFFTSLSGRLRFIVEVVVISFLILLFGEVLPKVYANRKSLAFAGLMAKPIKFLNTFLTPLSILLIKLTATIENKLGARYNKLSVEKLSKALELTSNTTTSEEEKKILKGIVTFGNTETVQIMRPRTDVCAISDSSSFEEVLKIIVNNGYSRNPVYRDTVDNITGVLYAKDLLEHLNKSNFKWQTLLRKAFFVPENKKLDDLLKEFQEKKNHLAIVVDEYGGTSGIVTLEDVIEEIVGDIKDEFDDEDLFYSKLDERNYIFDGKISIKDFCRIMGKQDEEAFEQIKGESETLAGFILEASGKFPKKGEKFNFESYTFSVELIDKRRIKQVKVSKNA
ncbi:MAG: gliding motility-associated protein GldE [Tenacibaculum sp.]